ncbi:calpain-13 isoform X2 [Perognathus longimembris pacificus]|uniref:calpain-13 isoform X2 n=1 Tax=Perognathus longimembris pacificus TaxID=214514 RepID=UPI00201845C8|nr:calpain-13 isoform X2 [Perognathus longimembris pacificus]
MEHAPELPTETSVIRFKDQDFITLRDHCLSRGLPFVDDTFPAEASSIGQKLLQGKNISNLQWKRPGDLSEGPPYFILEGASRFDIQQGTAGDCWFLAALGSLTQNPQCRKKILMEQSFSHQYAGIFRFRFWQCGQWVEVVVDDYLPVVGRDYLFVHPRNKQEFWPCLLEKAYAKLRGSYSHLHYGYLPDALVDLTGGVVSSVNLHSSPSDLLMVVKTAAKAGSLMTCATPKGLTDEAGVMGNGLVSQHAYTVTGAEQIQYRRGWEEIIRLWNPWGKKEWRGRWSDGSWEWQETRDRRKNQLYENKEDGEFWMSCQDFQENFSCLFICNQIPITLDHGLIPHERWGQMVFKNQVILGNTAGGPGRDSQYFFSVQELMEGNNAVVSVTVTPQSLKAEDEECPLSFQVFKFQHFRERLPPRFFSLFRNAIQGIDDKTKCNFTKFSHLSPGTYVVVLSAYKERVEFLLRIFLKMPDSDRNMNHSFSHRSLKGSVPENGSQQSIFYRYAQGLDIDATQLQNLLNQELLTGPPGDTFSLDQCRSLIALMDLKVNGRLDQEEFGRLWSRLVHCQHIFQNIQKSSRVLLTSDLWKAIQNTDFLTGISISCELQDLLALRYGDSVGHITFPSLVCLLLRLEIMAKAFRNFSKDGKGLYLTEMEVSHLPIPTAGRIPSHLSPSDARGNFSL